MVYVVMSELEDFFDESKNKGLCKKKRELKKKKRQKEAGRRKRGHGKKRVDDIEELFEGVHVWRVVILINKCI